MQKEQIISINVEILALDSTCVKVHPDGTGALKKVANKVSVKQKVVGTPSFSRAERKFPLLMDKAYEGDETRLLAIELNYNVVLYRQNPIAKFLGNMTRSFTNVVMSLSACSGV